MPQHIYLDNASTTRVRPEVIHVMTRALQHDYGNPSSPHELGITAEHMVREAREHIASALDVNWQDIVFTSGGTEANNLAIFGTSQAFRRQGGSFVCVATDHPSVIQPLAELQNQGFSIHHLPVTAEGYVKIESMADVVRDDTRLVSIAYVNNEIGTIQPIQQLVEAIRAIQPQAVIHIDAIQALGKLPITPRQWNADLVSLSAHKIHGPKGVGALYVRRGQRLAPLLAGGNQEHGIRSGTENVPGIVGMGEAVRLGMQEQDKLVPTLYRLKRRFVEQLRKNVPDMRVIGPPVDKAAPHIISVSIPKLKGEVMVRMASEQGVHVSTGSACSTKQQGTSHVLKALALSPDVQDGTLRISFGRETKEEDVDAACLRLSEAYSQLKLWI